MKSAGVQPFHWACMMGQYAFVSLPGLSTTIIPATQRPRKTSRHINRGADLVLFSIPAVELSDSIEAVGMTRQIYSQAARMEVMRQ